MKARAKFELQQASLSKALFCTSALCPVGCLPIRAVKWSFLLRQCWSCRISNQGEMLAKYFLLPATTKPLPTLPKGTTIMKLLEWRPRGLSVIFGYSLWFFLLFPSSRIDEWTGVKVVYHLIVPHSSLWNRGQIFVNISVHLTKTIRSLPFIFPWSLVCAVPDGGDWNSLDVLRIVQTQLSSKHQSLL